MSKTSVITAGLGAALLPLALSAAMLAPTNAWAAGTAQAGESGSASVSATSTSAASGGTAASGAAAKSATVTIVKLADDGFEDGKLTFGGVSVTLPDGCKPRVSGLETLASAYDGTLSVALEKLDFVTVPEDGDLAEAFKTASAKTVAGWSTSSVEEKDSVDLGDGATAHVFEVRCSGPYEAVENADGTTTASKVGEDGTWTMTQAYVALPTGGFTMVQVAYSDNAGDEAKKAAQAVVDSLALAKAEASDGDSADGQADEELPEGTVKAGGFTFKLPQGLEGDNGVWLGTTDNVLVQAAGTLVTAEDAKTLDEAGVKELLESAADEMGATFNGSSQRTLADGSTQVTVGVFALANGSETYECLLVLVPVADGSVEGLSCVLDPAAAKNWGDKMTEMVYSIEVTPAADDDQDTASEATVG